MSVSDYYNKHISSILVSLDYLEGDKVEKFVDLILNCKGKIFFTGIGKNGHVAAKATSTFSSIGVPCFYINPIDSVHGDMGVIDEDDLLIAISKSGNTEELINFLYHVEHKNCKIVSIHSNNENKSKKKNNRQKITDLFALINSIKRDEPPEIRNELKELNNYINKDCIDDHRIISIKNINDDLFNLEVCFLGPKETPYEDGINIISIKIPNEYPIRAPHLKFENKIYHPNRNI